LDAAEIQRLTGPRLVRQRTSRGSTTKCLGSVRPLVRSRPPDRTCGLGDPV